MPVEQKTHHTLCRMCDEHCGIDVRTEGGYIVEIVGNKAHPSSHGKLCVKARAAMDMVYHPQRLLKPLKRTDGGWSEISLEQALDEIGGRLSDIEERFGSRSISVWKGEAVGFAQQEALARRFIHALGSPNYLSNDSTCFAARHIAYKLVEGGWPVPDFENARCIVIWAANPPYSHPTMARHISAARRKRAKLVVVDPRLSAIAQRADFHAALRPGTDGALAWGLIHQLLETGVCDTDALERCTVGSSAVAEYARAFTLDAVEEETGVPAAMVRSIALAMGAAAPRVAVYAGNGLEHHENAVNTVRTIAMLDGLLGALGQRGGTCFRDGPALQDLTLYESLPLRHLAPLGADRFPVLYDLRQECHTMTALQAILLDDPYPLRAMLVTGANPAMTNPNSSRVRQALGALDLLVVRDLFMTETAALADYVLPAASFLERTELYAHTKHQIVTLTDKVVSFSEVQNEYEFWRDLAHRLGIGEYFPWPDEDALNRWLLEPTGLTLEELTTHPEGVRYCPVGTRRARELGVDTPSGKVEFVSQYLKDLGHDELSLYRRPTYRRSFDPRYPFVLMTGARELRYLHSRLRDVPGARRAVPRPAVEMHPDDGAALGVRDGDLVRITSRIGCVEIPVRLTAANDILRSCLQITHGRKEANVNFVTHDDRFDPISGFPLMKAVEVGVEKM